MQHRVVALAVALGVATGVIGSAVQAQQLSLLPTQQRVQPLGKEIDLGLFPAGMALSGDGRLALVTNNGFILQSLTVVDTANLKALDKTVGLVGINVLFIGVAIAPDGRTGYASGHSGADDAVYTMSMAPGPTLTFGKPIVLPRGSFAAGMAMSPDGARLYVAENLANALAVIDTHTKTVLASIPVGRQPWGVAVHPTLPRVYVTNRVDRTVSIIDTDTLSVIGSVVQTGNGPNAVAVSPNGAKIFVANATSDDLTVFDVDQPGSPRQLALTPFAGALPGSSPNALTFSPDGSRLYVANAWDNDLAVVSPDTESVEGLIPTGWYPSGVAVSPDNRRLYVINMKGARTYPRTNGRQKLDYDVNRRLDGTYGVRGTLQVLPVPSDPMLGRLDRRVRSNNGFDTGVRPSTRPTPNGPCSPIPCQVGDPSPIKHVVFIVRENKTYDQDLGDVPQGDGEPSYVLYPQVVTPNLHALVNEFVLMDRLFADSEKSEAGHQWCTAAIDVDYIEKTWTSTSFGGRPDDIQGGHLPPVSQPEGLYWFDNCFMHGVSFRKYGDFTRADDSGTPISYWLDNTDTNYVGFSLDYHDQARYEEWKREFDQQVSTDTFPQFTYITVPNDHTKGTQQGMPDPRSFVAENDYATGEIVEAISNSPYWQDTVIFMVEDDPQSGVDHVDSHRTVGFVVGPYVRRHHVSHTRYDMASMHRTMELILGLPPMSQFDQMAVPMREIFTDQPDFTPYTTVPPSYPFIMARPNRHARLSARQDWSAPDRVPDAVLNKILWDYLKSPEQ
jgi:YVTN family beta-propeller protein